MNGDPEAGLPRYSTTDEEAEPDDAAAAVDILRDDPVIAEAVFGEFGGRHLRDRLSVRYVERVAMARDGIVNVDADACADMDDDEICIPVEFEYSVVSQELRLKGPTLNRLPVSSIVMHRRVVHTNAAERGYRYTWHLRGKKVSGTLRYDSEDDDEDDEDDDMPCGTLLASRCNVSTKTSLFFNAVLAGVASCCANVCPPDLDTAGDYEWWARDMRSLAAMLDFGNTHLTDMPCIRDAIIDHTGTHYRLPRNLAERIRDWVMERHCDVLLAEDLRLEVRRHDETKITQETDDTFLGRLAVYYPSP